MDGYDCEFVLVNDGSPKDNTYGEIKKLGEQYQNVKGINLLRNFGQHNALMAALHYTEGDFILGMDDDMLDTSVPDQQTDPQDGRRIRSGLRLTIRNEKIRS